MSMQPMQTDAIFFRFDEEFDAKKPIRCEIGFSKTDVDVKKMVKYHQIEAFSSENMKILFSFNWKLCNLIFRCLFVTRAMLFWENFGNLGV